MAEEVSIGVDTCHIIYIKNVNMYYDYHLTVQWIAEKVRILAGCFHAIFSIAFKYVENADAGIF
jgi:hypothetical protein